MKPVAISGGVRLRSHVSLLDAIARPHREYLLKNCHQLEVDGIENHVQYAEYLTYWFPNEVTA